MTPTELRDIMLESRLPEDAARAIAWSVRPVRWATCTASPVGPRFWTAGPRYPAVPRPIAAWRAW